MNSAARQPAVLLLRRASLLRLQRSRFASATYTGNGGCRYGITSQAKLNESSAGSRRRQHTNTNTSTAGRFSSGRWEWESLLTPGACVLLAAALLSSSNQSPASTGWWPFSGWGRQGGRESSSPFDDIVPRRAREQRAKAEVQMRAYLEKKRVPMQRLIESLREGKTSREEFDKQMVSFNNDVELDTHRIIFGATDPPDARRQYEAKYGNCRYTPEAISAVAALSPVVEIEAGRGHWQRALTSAGATVVSFDKWAGAFGPLPPHLAPVSKVLPGDENAIRMHRDKTLLLVYPQPGDTALRCLQEYKGGAMVYVGEGRGGANADDEFFDGLDAEWEVTTVLELDPFQQCFEKFFVLHRKKLSSVYELENGDKANAEAPVAGQETTPAQ